MPNQEQCFDAESLRRFIAEEMDEQDESLVIGHIEVCCSCRDGLERLSWGQWEQGELRHSLSQEDRSDQTVTSSDRLASISKLLAPTDDPTKLGRLGSYEVCGVIGRGSSGIVFKAFDPRLSRYVAIKMLAPDYAASTHSRARFEREARAIAAVRNDCVIAIHGVAEFGGNPYIVMQYVPGESLQQRISRRGPLGTDEVARIGLQIATGLAAAHRQGIVHRDVKPANILLEDGLDRAVVTDFGLARVVDDASMTRSGVVSGTPQYMSPEQAKGQTLDARSDLFSLGSVLYAACTGCSPFRHETLFGVLNRVCNDNPRPTSQLNPNVDEWLSEFIAKLHSKDRDVRFESAEEVADLIADEVAYMQAPAMAPKPSRMWMKRPSKFETLIKSRARWQAGFAATATLLLIVVLLTIVHFTADLPKASMQAEAFGIKSHDAMHTTRADLHRDARQLFENCEYEAAVGKCREMLRRRPQDAEAAALLAGCLHMLGHVDDAIDWYKAAVGSPTNQAKNYYNLACAYALLNKKRQAFDSLESAIESGFRNLEHLKSDADLHNLRDDARYFKLVVNEKLAR